MSIINRTLPAAPGSYATAAEVRTMSGLSSTNDISDSDLNEIILTATLIFTGQVTNRIDGAVLEVKDTARKVFKLPTGLIADLNADAVVGADDVTVRFHKVGDDGKVVTSATGTITINDATTGVIETATAMPEDYTPVCDYAHYLRPLELARAKRAVRYLAAHVAWLRVKTPGRITRADLTGLGRTDADDGDRSQFFFRHRSRWLDLYKREVAALVGHPIF